MNLGLDLESFCEKNFGIKQIGLVWTSKKDGLRVSSRERICLFGEKI